MLQIGRASGAGTVGSAHASRPVSASAPVALATAAATLISAALLAAWLPARRAQRIDVMRTLQR